MRLGCLNVAGMDVGKISDSLKVCEEWKEVGCGVSNRDTP